MCSLPISLGHAAIFLLGAATRDFAPTPIILRSGDVLVMSGPGRQAYHGESHHTDSADASMLS